LYKQHFAGKFNLQATDMHTLQCVVAILCGVNCTIMTFRTKQAKT